MTSYGSAQTVSREVSIHTPTQGVTGVFGWSIAHHQVSIHTPTQGVTHCGIRKIPMFLSFNPHTHAGCDIDSWHKERGFKFQSTHPRRVWRCKRAYRQRYFQCFNPHTHAGCDHGHHALRSITGLFQSTHPRRVWRADEEKLEWLRSFNPHTHAGCDNIS